MRVPSLVLPCRLNWGWRSLKFGDFQTMGPTPDATSRRFTASSNCRSENRLKMRRVDIAFAADRQDKGLDAGCVRCGLHVSNLGFRSGIRGVGQLRLTGSVLADIYLGKITKWNARAISDLNPGLALPDQAVIPIHRAEGSRSTS